MFCTNCKKTNHNISNCFFLHKEKRPSNWKSPNKIIKDKKHQKINKKDEKRKQELLNTIIETDSTKESDSSNSEINIKEEINILQENIQENISFNKDLFKNIKIKVNTQSPIHNIYIHIDNKTTDINNNLL